MPVARSMVLLLGLAVFVTGETPTSSAAFTAAVVDADSSGTPYVAPTLEVRGARLTAQRRADRQTPFATVLEASSWAGQARSAAEVLGRAVGVHVRDSGGVGGYSTLSLRGSSAAQVPVYLDGVLLNGPGTGEVNLADVDLAQIDRIEVYRGSAPLTLGGASLGGAVHLFSANGLQPLRFALSHGTHDSWHGEVAGALAAGPWQLQLRAHGVRSEGNWDFHDDRGTPYNPHDDLVRERINNDVRGGGLLLSASRPWRGGTVQIGEMIDAREQGVPGHSVLQSQSARSHSLTHQLRTSWARGGLGAGRLRSIDLYHRTEIQGVVDLDAELGRSPRDREDRLQMIGASLSGAGSPTGDRLWRGELDWAQLRTHDAARLDGAGAPQTRWTVAGALQPQFRMYSDRLLITPGLRLEALWQRWHASMGSGSLPSGEVTRDALLTHTAQAGVRWSLSDELSVKANVGAFERAPTLFELFGDRGTAQGNADLRPESGTNRDLGLVWSRPIEGRRMAASVFWNDAFDLITFVRNSPATAKAMNVGRAEIKGLELEADFGRFGPWSSSASLTRMVSRDLTNSTIAGGKQLPGRPGYEFELQQGLHVGSFDAGFSLMAMGDNYAQTGERAPVPSRVLLGAELRWRWHDELALLVRIDNLGGVEVFDLWGHPLPQRRISLVLRAGVFGAQ